MAGSRCFACYASLLCELDAECFKLEGADLEGDAAVFRYRRFAAGVLHGGAGRDGARAAGHGQNGAGAHAPGLVQAHDDAIAVLGALHRFHHDARRVHGDEGVAFRQRAVLRGQRPGVSRAVQRVALAHHAACAVIALVGQQRVSERMRTAVRVGVGMRGRTQKRQATEESRRRESSHYCPRERYAWQTSWAGPTMRSWPFSIQTQRLHRRSICSVE